MSGELSGFGSNVQRVVIDPSGKACTNGQIIWIPESMHDNPTYNQIMQEAILAHENAHHRYTDFCSWDRKVVQPTKKNACDPLLHKFVNMLEDARINHLFGQDWKGSRKRMQFTHEIFMQRHQENTTDDSPLKEQAMVAMMTEAIVHEPHWFTTPEVVDFMDANRALLNNAIKQRNTKAVIDQSVRLIKAFRDAFPDDEPDPSDTDGMSSDDVSMSDIEEAADVQDREGRNPEQASTNRFKDMKEAEKAEPEEEKDSEEGDSESTLGDSESEGSDSDSEGAGGEDSEDSEEGDSEDSEGAGGEDSDSDSEPMEGDADSSGADADSDGEEGDGDSEGDGEEDGAGGEDSEEDGEPCDGDGSTVTSGLFEEAWADLIDVVDADVQDIAEVALDVDNGLHTGTTEQVTTMTGKTTEIDESTTVTDCGHKIKVVATSRDFINRDSAVLNHATTYDHVAKVQRKVIRKVTSELTRRLKGVDPTWETDTKTGRLNPTKAYKLSNAKVHNIDRVYRKKSDESVITGNAIILIDASGSMGCGSNGKTRATHAANAAVVFSEVFRTLGISYEVVDFNTNYGTTMRVRKAFGSAGTSTLDKACIAAPYVGCENSDGYAVQWCLDKLSTMNGSRLLIVISDGAPAGESPAGLSSTEHLIEVTNNANKKIGLLGIGIAGQDTSRFYPNAVTVSNESELAKEAMVVLRPMLKKIVPRK